MPAPDVLQINAWTGEDVPASGPIGNRASGWALAKQVDVMAQTLAPEPLASLQDWRNEDVGWGLLLNDDDDVEEVARARGEDAPEPLRQLLQARPGSPVLRYRANVALTHVRRYYEDREPQDIALSGSQRGVGVGRLPRYVLIYGTPAEVPWRFQYLLSGPCMVGRLALQGDALWRYIDHLLRGWAGTAARSDSPVVWAVDWGGDDITELMRKVIAKPIADALMADLDIRDKRRYIDGSVEEATLDALGTALANNSPGLIVTTSHGMTAPLDDADAMLANLGLPVDSERAALGPEALLSGWQPSGAIWYAHACCSAGCADRSAFKGLVGEGSVIYSILDALERLGNQVAPLPQALLGAEEPLRAFVGHVEPTFDWTIRDKQTGQRLTDSIKQSIYNHLFQPVPLGLAMRESYLQVGELLGQFTDAVDEFNRGITTWDIAASRQLAARDRQSMVILGDPTVMLPPLG
jgi:hypothetical protein